MSFKYINILLTSVCFLTNDVYSLNYYNDVVLPNLHNLEQNQAQLQQEYINNQNDEIYKKIDEKLAIAKQQLDHDNSDEELKKYVENLENLRNKQNISQEVDIDELINLGLLDLNTYEQNNNIVQFVQVNDDSEVNNNANQNQNNNNAENNNNIEHTNNLMQNNNNIAEQNNNIEQVGNNIEQINNNQEQNDGVVQNNNNENNNMAYNGNANNLHILEAIFNDIFLEQENVIGIVPINFNLHNNIEEQLNMKTSFETLLKKIKDENRIKIKNNIIKEFLGYIFGDNYHNLNAIFWNANNEKLKTIKEILELEEVSVYMKKYYMDIENKLTTLVNTFIEQCQEGYYGDISNKEYFYEIFDKFFDETKKIQYIGKIESANDILDEIEDDIGNGSLLKTQLLELLDKHFKEVTNHINNIFKELSNKKEECYKQFNKQDKSTLKFEIVEQKDTNYILRRVIYPIMYEIDKSTMNYKNLTGNCRELRKFLFDEYNSTHFKIRLQTDISSIKFKIDQNNLLNEKEKKIKTVLDHSQEDKISEDDFGLLLKEYAIKPNADTIQIYCKSYNNYYSSNINFIQKLEQDVCIIKTNNKLNESNDQLKLDLFDKIKWQNYSVDKADTYLLTEILYSTHK